MRERDWGNLVWNVRRGRSVMFTGADLDADAEAGTAALTRRLGDLLRDEGRTVMGQGLSAVAQQLEADGREDRSSKDERVVRGGAFGSHPRPPAGIEPQVRPAARRRLHDRVSLRPRPFAMTR